MTKQDMSGSLAAALSAREFRSFSKTWSADYVRAGEVRFRFWAPDAERVMLRLGQGDHEMPAAGDGWFELLATGISPGTRYSFVLPDGLAVPDPAARAQDGGIEGASVVTDPAAYVWRYPKWPGRAWEEAVFYELHVGTFTPGGTFRAAIDKLPYLAELGITAIEVMPVNQFPGERGWGYDGVLIYAPHHAYGEPDDFKAFIDEAHGLGMMVFLDVVYNHFGPEGNYLSRHAGSFFDADRTTPWGPAIDFSERPVRDFFIENALYWLIEFNLDGLRIDAVHAIEDLSERHVISELGERVHAECSGRRRHLVVEDSRNIVRFLEREGVLAKEIDAGWNDDFHHVAHILATGETAGYYGGFAEDPGRDFGVALAQGYVQSPDAPAIGSGGEIVPAPSLLPPTAYIVFLQNHDQIGNRAYGDRLDAIADTGLIEAMQNVLMLSPSIPLIFMGEEYAEVRPFQFFCDYRGSMASAVREGRLGEALTFGSVPPGAGVEDLPDPNAVETFERSKLDWIAATGDEGKRKQAMFRMLLAKRSEHVVPGLRGALGRAGKLLSSGNGICAIDWQLDGFVLELRANLGKVAAAAVPRLSGEVIHVYPVGASVEDGTIGPLTVVFAKRA